MPPKPAPEPAALPPENVEEEALAAFTEEAPPVEETTPQTIDFTCEWCESELRLPLDQGGKQTQCPNKDCRRIIKVPMPKIVEKKDWRKINLKGPALAAINMPEQLDDAWGTEAVVRARQASLAQAGAIAEKPKPKRDAFAWATLILTYAGVAAFLVGAGVGFASLFSTNQQHHTIGDLEKLVIARDPKISNPLLAAEVRRTLGILWLRDGKAFKANEKFDAAQRLEFKDDDKDLAVNEQLFLIELAAAQCELGGVGDDLATNNKRKPEWGLVQKSILTTLSSIKAPEAQEWAMREVASRLIDRKQPDIALSLAGSLSGQEEKRMPAFSQQIALLVLSDNQENLPTPLKELPKPDAKELADGRVRAGGAEGYARKGEFDQAAKFTKPEMAGGTPKDRLDACLGVAMIALQMGKNEEAARFVEAALALRPEAERSLSDWNRLQLVRLAVRTGESERVKGIVENLKGSFKARAQLEIFLAKCEKTRVLLKAEDLANIDLTDDKEGVTLALAWNALARHNTRLGASRAANQTMLQKNLDLWPEAPPSALSETLHQMVDAGTYIGALK